jgi:hypothetical protein
MWLISLGCVRVFNVWQVSAAGASKKFWWVGVVGGYTASILVRKFLLYAAAPVTSGVSASHACLLLQQLEWSPLEAFT